MSKLKIEWTFSQIEKTLFVIMTALFLLVLGYVVHINFSYYWDNLHFDIANDLHFVREAAYQGTLFPYEWLHVFEVRLVHLTTVILPIYLITGNVHLSYPIAVTLMIFVNCFLFYYMLSYRKIRLLPVAVGGAMLIMAFSRFGWLTVFDILFVNGSYSLHLATIFFTVGVYLRLKFNNATNTYRNVKLNKILAYTIWIVSVSLAFAQGIQSSRLLFALYFPLALLEIYPLVMNAMALEKQKMKTRSPIIFTLACLLASVSGSVLMQLLLRQDIVISYYTAHNTGLVITESGALWARFGTSFAALLQAIGLLGGEVFSVYGLIYLLRLAMVIALVLAIKKIASLADNQSDIVLISFFLVSLLCSLFVMTFTSAGVAARHVMTLLPLICVMAVVALDYFMKIENKYLLTVVCIAASLQIIVSTQTLGMERREMLNQDRQHVIDFLIDGGFTIGYGTPFQGEVLAAKADFEFSVITLSDNLVHQYRRGMTLSEFYHTQNRVFLVTTSSHIDNAGAHAISKLEHGERHDFPRGWVVYTFENNPWQLPRPR